MKINTNGSFLSTDELKKKNSQEKFFLSKVLTDTDEVVIVYSDNNPDLQRGELVDITLNIDLQKSTIFTSFSNTAA